MYNPFKKLRELERKVDDVNFRLDNEISAKQDILREFEEKFIKDFYDAKENKYEYMLDGKLADVFYFLIISLDKMYKIGQGNK